MEPSTPNPPPAPARGLPPVTPPSGTFIAQLFVVPGLIVFTVVMLLLGVMYLWKSGRVPEYYLRQLDSPNADIRWRAASDLAQILKRPEKGSQQWKADAAFALALAERLRAALDELAQQEKALQKEIAALPADRQDAAWNRLKTQRDHVHFLASAMGDFFVPVGVPLLSEIAQSDDSPDVKGNTLRRRQAVWALANLGENRKGFKKLPAEEQAAIVATLTQAAAGSGPQALWARNGLHYLDPALVPSGPADGLVQVDAVLARCADAQDRFLREQVALAFNFWDGPLAEPTLLKLARDDGHGTLLQVTED